MTKRWFGVGHQSENCLNESCVCHTAEEHRVRTPFGMDKGDNPYCCNRCSKRRNIFLNIMHSLGDPRAAHCLGLPEKGA